MISTVHFVNYTLQQIILFLYNSNNVSDYQLLYLQLEIRQRFAFHINRRHFTCERTYERRTTAQHNKPGSAIYNITSRKEQKFYRNTVITLFGFSLSVIHAIKL